MPRKNFVALAVGNTSKDSWVSNLVAVEVQDWENDTIGQWVHELVGLPRSCKWAGLCLAVADNSDCQQGWVVQDSAVCVGEDVAQLAALVDGAWSLRCVGGEGIPPGYEKRRKNFWSPSSSSVMNG